MCYPVHSSQKGMASKLVKALDGLRSATSKLLRCLVTQSAHLGKGGVVTLSGLTHQRLKLTRLAYREKYKN